LQWFIGAKANIAALSMWLALQVPYVQSNVTSINCDPEFDGKLTNGHDACFLTLVRSAVDWIAAKN
jgi:hypothetical protein